MDKGDINRFFPNSEGDFTPINIEGAFPLIPDIFRQLKINQLGKKKIIHFGVTVPERQYEDGGLLLTVYPDVPIRVVQSIEQETDLTWVSGKDPHTLAGIRLKVSVPQLPEDNAESVQYIIEPTIDRTLYDNPNRPIDNKFLTELVTELAKATVKPWYIQRTS